MPGVYVTSGVRTGPTTAAVAPASTFFVTGTAERGPTDVAKLVTSLSDFQTYYGLYNSAFSLQQHVQTFFEEGGTKAYIARVVGASATAGAATLLGASVSGAASASCVASMTLTAANPGAWSSDVTYTVTGVTTAPVVNIFFKGTQVFTTGALTTVSSAVDKINTSAVATIYVKATATVGANILLLVSTATALSVGVAGNAALEADYVTGLTLFDQGYGAGAVAIPGQSGSATWNGLMGHASANNRIALLANAVGTSALTAVVNATGYASASAAPFTGIYFPWVTMSGTGGVTLTISPESFVAAKRAIAHVQSGPWRAGAGLLAQAKFVTGLETTVPITKTTAATLDAGRVNALRIVDGAVRVYGARSVSSDEDNFRYITYRDTVNYIVTESEKRLEDLVFSPIDGRQGVFSQIESRLIGLLDPLRDAGGLYESYNAAGELVDPGYMVKVDTSLNPASQLATGVIKARIGVRVSSVGDRIEVEVLKSNLTTGVA
jgi:hypothetical protein